jgi:iron complex outermembrane receptor protein
MWPPNTLRPSPALDGQPQLVALATDWRINRDAAGGRVEWSHKIPASQAGYSLLGNRLPAPWTRGEPQQPALVAASVFDALTGTLRFEQAINSHWRWSASWARQQLKTDDRLAYAFGCSAENNYDRYCSDGTYDLYDFRSENERRRQDALAAAASRAKLDTGASGMT